MQIVIDIPKEVKESIENGSFGAKYNIYDLCGFVMNGTPLPKNHGRLIDADVFYKELIKAIERYEEPLRSDIAATVMIKLIACPSCVYAESEE